MHFRPRPTQCCYCPEPIDHIRHRWCWTPRGSAHEACAAEDLRRRRGIIGRWGRAPDGDKTSFRGCRTFKRVAVWNPRHERKET